MVGEVKCNKKKGSIRMNAGKGVAPVQGGDAEGKGKRGKALSIGGGNRYQVLFV